MTFFGSTKSPEEASDDAEHCLGSTATRSASSSLRQAVLLVTEVRDDTKFSTQGTDVVSQSRQGHGVHLAAFDSRHAGLGHAHRLRDILLGAVLLGPDPRQMPGPDVVVCHVPSPAH